uniref:Amine oxidase domain-containing protein n=1 Tax=Timema shepardi TaxID=629360 RepID=A0A7R9AN23_TIMSH|nr:unnamed protein product [Timema shepardi]
MASARNIEIKNRCKILIIGAGMAGLSAAKQLIQNNITDFKILEARNRIGGRIVSVQTAVELNTTSALANYATEADSHKVELGANWIHGVLGNPMYELAMANGLIDIVHVPKPHKVVAATEEGRQIPFHILQEIYEAYVCFLRRCEEYFLCHYLPPTGINSVGQHIGLETALYLDRSVDSEDRHLCELIFDCLLKRETCITGCHSMNEIDLLELGSYTELQGGNIVLPTGYSSILGAVAKDIPPENIIKKCVVTTIRWRYADEVLVEGVTSPGGDSGIDLLANGDPGNESDDSDKTVTEDPLKVSAPSSRDGSSEKDGLISSVKNINSSVGHCDEGCVESSLSTLENVGESSSSSSHRVYERGGPPRSNSIGPPPNVEVVCEDGTRYYANHVICTLPLGVLKHKAATLFLPQLPQYKIESINRLLFGTVDKIILEYDRPFLNPDISEVMLLWETEMDGKKENEEDLNTCWFRKIYSFSKISDTLLLGWISGKEAEFMETLPNETVADKCTEILRKFLNDPFVPKPKRCFVLCCSTSWSAQPYTRGSYTAMAVGASQVDIENIAQPLFANPRHTKRMASLLQPSLLFAGEHTHSSFYSTVHGAYLTGRAAAQALVIPDSPEETVMECEGTNDLSSWIQGISLN